MNLGDMRRHQEASDRRDEEFCRWQKERSEFGNAVLCSGEMLFANCKDYQTFMSLIKYAGENVLVNQKGFNVYVLEFYNSTKIRIEQKGADELIAKLIAPKGAF